MGHVTLMRKGRFTWDMSHCGRDSFTWDMSHWGREGLHGMCHIVEETVNM